MLIAVAIAFTSCNNNPGKDTAEKADSANDSHYDDNIKRDIAPVDDKSADFLVSAVNESMAEIQLAKLAKQKAATRKVKDYAGMILSDHGVLYDQLKAISSGLYVVLPSSPDEAVQTKLQLLNKHTGQDFDKGFLDMMIRDHKKTIQLFEHASSNVNNAEVKTLIDNALPQLIKHLDSARVLEKMHR